MAVAMLFHYWKNKEVPAGLLYLKLDASVIKGIYAIGFPAIVMQALMSFMTYGINIIFGMVSTAAVTAYGIFYKIQQFLFFAGFGLRDAIPPIVSINYGLGNKARVREGIHCGFLYTEIIMALGILVLQLCAEPLTAVFGLSDETTALCVLAIRIISPGFLFAAFSNADEVIWLAFPIAEAIAFFVALLFYQKKVCPIFHGAESVSRERGVSQKRSLLPSK